MASSTMVTKFLLTGFAEGLKLKFLHSILFLLMYLATLLGNPLIITATTLDQKLHTPMYFFLRILSILDMCFISVTVPNACVNSLTDSRAISVAGCGTQIFLVLYCAYVEMLLLTIMAQDCYVATCQPLHYTNIMNHQFCVRMTLAILLCGLVYAGVHTGNTFQLSFCQSNVVPQFFCDIPSLLRLSCSDTFNNELLILASAMGFGVGSFIFIVISYIRLFFTVLKFPTSRERGKDFCTCAPHIIVIFVFLSSAIYVYLMPSSVSDTFLDMVFCFLYHSSFINLITYSLRNKQIKGALKKIITQTFLQENIRCISDFFNAFISS